MTSVCYVTKTNKCNGQSHSKDSYANSSAEPASLLRGVTCNFYITNKFDVLVWEEWGEAWVRQGFLNFIPWAPKTGTHWGIFYINYHMRKICYAVLYILTFAFFQSDLKKYPIYSKPHSIIIFMVSIDATLYGCMLSTRDLCNSLP